MPTELEAVTAERDALAATLTAVREQVVALGEWADQPMGDDVRSAFALMHRSLSPLLDASADSARVLARVKAEALREAAKEWHEPHDPRTYAASEWLNDRADRIESEASDAEDTDHEDGGL